MDDGHTALDPANFRRFNKCLYEVEEITAHTNPALMEKLSPRKKAKKPKNNQYFIETKTRKEADNAMEDDEGNSLPRDLRSGRKETRKERKVMTPKKATSSSTDNNAASGPAVKRA
ncbi:hypothetical protein FQN53_009736 [Emmonsiellopsis sp. PD_33]|nr:hypothetical protein FQN53_009736 [Emmonsiellopsis sp. PD_33]